MFVCLFSCGHLAWEYLHLGDLASFANLVLDVRLYNIHVHIKHGHAIIVNVVLEIRAGN